MSIAYHHTQAGKTILAFLLAALVIVAMTTLNERSHALFIFFLVILSVTALLFCSFTIRIEGGLLHWHFGPGFWKKSVPLKDIARVDKVRNRWYYGWGIRYTRHGWLYTVSGLWAVEIRLKTGKQLRLGTDEPGELMAAISFAQTTTTDAA